MSRYQKRERARGKAITRSTEKLSPDRLNVQQGERYQKNHMTIIIRTILNVLPEKQKEMLQTLLSLPPPPGEDGCLSYDIFSDIGDKNVFSLISQWQSRRQLDQHISSDNFSVLLGTRSLLSEPLDIQILSVSHMEGLEAVNAVRKKEIAPCRFMPKRN